MAYDHQLTDVARVLAGLAPENAAAFSGVTNRPAWKNYRMGLDANWTHAAAGRFETIERWRDSELSGYDAGCRVLLYPFAGPDILNAYQFFPRCDGYVLFGLEHLGRVPDLPHMTPERADRMIAELQGALADLFERNYFITSRMMGELGEGDVDGTVPILLLLLARLDLRIVGVEHLVLSADGLVTPSASPASAVPASRIRHGDGRVEAIRIQFASKDDRAPRTLVYFRAQAQNAALRPVVTEYLRHLAPTTTFLKSASYLLHTPAFSQVRDAVLDVSNVILQDDSGVPYRLLMSPDWRVMLYGKYSKPIKDFNYGFQPDLDAAYTKEGSSRPLPFSFGYHWRDGNWGAMLAVRVSQVNPVKSGSRD